MRTYKVKIEEPIIKKSIIPGMTKAISEIEFRKPKLGDMIKSSVGVNQTDYALIALNYMVLLNMNDLNAKDFESMCMTDGNTVMELIGNLVSGAIK